MRLAYKANNGQQLQQAQIPRSPGVRSVGKLDSVQQGTRVRAHRGGSDCPDADNRGHRGGGATLSAHHAWLRRQRVLHVEPHPSDADIVELNVGGTQMVTCRSTLRQVPGSMLAVLFDPANQHLLNRDAAGCTFLDHDPAAFGLVLRYLRELKITGGCTSSVLLPPISPTDAGPFRSLVTHLGLQIDEAAITAATARGAAIAAAAGSSATYTRHEQGGGSQLDRPVSPYASKPAKGSACSTSVGQATQQYQQWQQQQLRHQQQQHFLIRPQPPELPPSGCTSKKPPSSPPFSSPFRLLGPNMQHMMQAASKSPVHTTKQQQKPFVESYTQYYYINTSPVVKLASNADGVASAVAPLKLTVCTEADMLAQQQQQQQQQQRGQGLAGLLNSSSGSVNFSSFLSGCNVFCNITSSKHLLTMSLVARSSAAVDNMFVGVTSTNHTDQRGPQIPCFGWRQSEFLKQPEATADDQGNTRSAQVESGTVAPSSSFQGSSTASADSAQTPETTTTPAHQQLWQAGDLVQLQVELGLTNRLLLKVNGHEVTGGYSIMELPTFRQWCWYLALFRGTDVASVVFEQDSVTVYSGDYKLKRYLG